MSQEQYKIKYLMITFMDTDNIAIPFASMKQLEITVMLPLNSIYTCILIFHDIINVHKCLI